MNFLWAPQNMVVFDVEGTCSSPTGHQPWTCYSLPRYGLAVRKEFATDPGDGPDCTSNP